MDEEKEKFIEEQMEFVFGEIEKDQVISNDALEQVAALADRMTSILGVNSEGKQLVKAPGKDQMEKLADWAEKQGIKPALSCNLDLASLIASIVYRLKELRTLSEVTIPETLASLGLSKFTTVDGCGIEVKDELAQPGFKAGHEMDAVAWLEEKGLADAVKRELKFSVSRNDLKQVQAIRVLASKLGLPLAEHAGIHPSTFKALVKEQLGRGVQFPEEFFNVYQYKKTEIKSDR